MSVRGPHPPRCASHEDSRAFLVAHVPSRVSFRRPASPVANPGANPGTCWTQSPHPCHGGDWGQRQSCGEGRQRRGQPLAEGCSLRGGKAGRSDQRDQVPGIMHEAIQCIKILYTNMKNSIVWNDTFCHQHELHQSNYGIISYRHIFDPCWPALAMR